VTAPGPGGGPHVRAISGVDGAALLDFNAYELDFFGGRYDIITAPGAGRLTEVRAFDGVTGEMLLNWVPYSGFHGGAFIAAVRW
jgi:trimeric autotransporter adhesin